MVFTIDQRGAVSFREQHARLDVGAPPSGLGAVSVDGKFFTRGGTRFHFRGVTYGTFLPRAADASPFPPYDQLKRDFADMADAGFTVVRTYTPPTEDVLALAEEFDLQLLAGIFFPDWRYLTGASRRHSHRVLRDARRTVRTEAERLAGHEQVLAVCLGNEIPADVVRWIGSRTVAGAIDELADAVRAVDPERLVTYANYPTAEYLPLDGVDFLTFNVFLERKGDFRRYLNRLHNLAGDRPLVLGEVGLDARRNGDLSQARLLDWQLETALERGVAGTCVYSWTDEWAVGGVAVEDWSFGITRDDRSARPGLEVARQWNGRTVADLLTEWPSISVVVCAYNAAATLDECLRHTCDLDYPDLEIIVVDDGSTDETADIARRYPRARLIPIEHAGLSCARNAGLNAASGEIVAYLDADAYPTPEWLYYLVLAFDGRMVGGAGGPNVPPLADGVGAERVARAPGGPVHVLVADDRAEHVPGCNMAFWRDVVVEAGGFEPVFTAAGDDVDLCWKVLDRGWEIAFHPAALVFHHRRPTLRAYLRQQREYGRSEALVEARHPDRFTRAGTARWRGRIYNPVLPHRRSSTRVFRGAFGTAAFQSVYQGGNHGLDLAHQIGVPVATALLPLIVLGLVDPWLALPALAALTYLAALLAIDVVVASAPRRLRHRRLTFRVGVAVHHLLQPLVRRWGRMRARSGAADHEPAPPPLPGPITRIGRGVLMAPECGPRARLAAALVAHLRAGGLRVATGTGWEDHDARLIGSSLVAGELVTSAHPVGFVQVRVRPRVRWRALAMAVAVSGGLAVAHAGAATAVAALVVIDVAVGAARIGPLARRTLIRGAT